MTPFILGFSSTSWLKGLEILSEEEKHLEQEREMFIPKGLDLGYWRRSHEPYLSMCSRVAQLLDRVSLAWSLRSRPMNHIARLGADSHHWVLVSFSKDKCRNVVLYANLSSKYIIATLPDLPIRHKDGNNQVRDRFTQVYPSPTDICCGHGEVGSAYLVNITRPCSHKAFEYSSILDLLPTGVAKDIWRRGYPKRKRVIWYRDANGMVLESKGRGGDCESG
ncbi:uncharacterized protein F5891DRAFT_996520 [Suillus fuscotomentosus]|uniref:Uncharacterized protein n=1 Tax=Suillus fuscotomentosus TaxID=1912939 RepID=A0AAD4HT10_9AGAM|nr:uncharacterized protein F5891DRAFT_996520 [Suillus fuscotomentosus]KAG1907677.1 hypothetical protein F5891DRAFT_996520 [Suillus fuscotomentosus]